MTDTTAPYLTGSTPEETATVSARIQQVQLVFSEAIVQGMGTLTLVHLGSGVQTSYTLSSSALTWGSNTLTLSFTSTLAFSSAYSLRIPAGAILDTAGNDLDEDLVYEFYTQANEDEIVPRVVSLLPAEGSTLVLPNTNLTLAFSEPVTLTSTGIQLLNAAGTVVQTFAAGSSRVSISGNTLTVDPSSDLLKGAGYRLQVPVGGVKDAYDNLNTVAASTSFTTARYLSTDLVLSADKATVSESGTVTFTFQGLTLSAGQTVAYTIDGVTRDDLAAQPLSGTVVLDANQQARLSITVLADFQTEGSETLNLRVGLLSSSVAVTDYTAAPPVTQLITLSPGRQSALLTSARERVEGTSGVDLAVIAGIREDYGVEIAGTRANVTQLGTFNTDTLMQVERLQFNDANVALDVDSAPGEVYRLYEASFDRAPDWGGAGYWLAQREAGMSMVEMAARFIASAEFVQDFGASVTTEQFVYKLYFNILDRTPDRDGLLWWLDALSGDAPMSWAEALARFADSPENRAQTADALSNGLTYQPWSG